jgi:hypothetical protein
VILGGVLIRPEFLDVYATWTFLAEGPTAGPRIAALLCCVSYFLAAVLNLGVPRTTAKLVPFEPRQVLPAFGRSFVMLWKDRYGRVSLAVTTVFWGAAGALQILVISGAMATLKMPLDRAPMITGVVVLGTAFGAIVAARNLQLRDALRLVPVGIAMGVGVLLMLIIDSVWPAVVLLFIVGGLAGFFLVPMNALLQHRGHTIMTAGQSISVQNFNENACVLGMTLGIGRDAELRRHDRHRDHRPRHVRRRLDDHRAAAHQALRLARRRHDPDGTDRPPLTSLARASHHVGRDLHPCRVKATSPLRGGRFSASKTRVAEIETMARGLLRKSTS